jgi:hypothetical protein
MMVKLRMNTPNHVHLSDSQIKGRSASVRRTKRALAGLLVVLVVAAMIGWLGFLGWGTVELFRAMAYFFKQVWTTVV